MAENTEKITCPACGKEMEEVYIPDVDFCIDICVHGCGGIYFDNREYKYFDEPFENIDAITKALENKTFTKVDETKTRVCPICRTNMVKNYSSAKKEIQIDECYSCGGKFLDYGELEKIRLEYNSENARTEDVIKQLYATVGVELKDVKDKASKVKFRHPLYKKIIDKLFF